MEVFTLVYLILCSLAAGYGAWWLYKAIKSISADLWDLQINKHSRLTSYLDELKAVINTNKDAITSSIRNSDKTIQNYVASENTAIKQVVMEQFAILTGKLVNDIELNRHSIANLISIVQELHKHTKKSIEDNSNIIVDLKNSLSYSISDSRKNISSQLESSFQGLYAEEQKRAKSITAGIDIIISKVSKFNELMESQIKFLEESDNKNVKRLDMLISSLSSSLKCHAETITSSCTQVINSEKELQQKTKSSFDLLNVNLSKYLTQLLEFDVIFNNLQNLYKSILEEEEKISNQEASLTSMVSRHAQIFEITSEMNKTSHEIFEFMKLYLVHSTIDNLK